MSSAASKKVHRAAIETLESRQLMSTTIPTDFTLESSQNVYSKASQGSMTISFTVEQGVDYFVVASGTAQIASGRRSDARFSTPQGGAAYSVDLGANPLNGNADRLIFTGVSDADGGGLHWASDSGNVYAADHVYGQLVTATGTTFSIEFKDPNPSDNSGYLTMSLYRAPIA